MEIKIEITLIKSMDEKGYNKETEEFNTVVSGNQSTYRKLVTEIIKLLPQNEEVSNG